jgi:putative spermidine/putrescine transport system ATP-binding protein
VLLLDEPLSALDAKVRVSLRNEIRRIQQQLKMTAIYVTHDQEEALAISDRIAVMAKGRIEQLENPEEIYSNPRTVFAASFVGSSNQFQGVLTSAAEGICQAGNFTLHIPPQPNFEDSEPVLVLVRPEEMSIQLATEDGEENVTSTDNKIPGVIELRTFLGPFTRFHLRVNESMTLTADVPSQQARDYFVAQNVLLSFPPNACQVLSLDARKDELEKLAEAETV